MNDLGIVLNILLGTGVGASLLTVVTAYRKWKSGEVVDDDAVIARLDKDNLDLRGRLALVQVEVEDERRRRWKAEDHVADCVRKLKILERKVDEHE